MEIIEQIGYSNSGLQRILTDAHKEARKAITTALLHWHDTADGGFLSLTVMGYENWVYHSEPESRQLFREWCAT